MADVDFFTVDRGERSATPPIVLEIGRHYDPFGVVYVC